MKRTDAFTRENSGGCAVPGGASADDGTTAVALTSVRYVCGRADLRVGYVVRVGPPGLTRRLVHNRHQRVLQRVGN